MRTQMRMMVSVLTGMLLLLSFAVSPTFARNSRSSQPLTQLTASNLYNNVPLPPPTWWNGYQCDSNHYNNDTTDNPKGLQANPLGSTTYRGEVPCGPMPLLTKPKVDVPVKFYSGTQAPDLEWECTELVKRYLYQAFGAPELDQTNGYQVVDNYTDPTKDTLFENFLNNSTPNQVPVVGDVLSFDQVNANGGHTAIVYDSTVDGTGNGTLSILEQNNTNDKKGTGILYVGNPNKKDPGNLAWHIDTEKKVLGAVLGWLHPRTVVSTGSQAGLISGVSAIAANDVWAIGTDAPSGHSAALIMHWNGSAWSAVSTNDFAGSFYGISGVSYVNTSGNTVDDIWAVGYNDPTSSGVILHYDGSNWSQLTTGVPSTLPLKAGKALSSTDQWFGGQGTDGNAVVLHHTGSDLTTNWISYSPSGGRVINAIDATSDSNVWVAGYDSNTKSFVSQWTGGPNWSQNTTVPNPGGYLDDLTGVYVQSFTDIYFTGWEVDTVTSTHIGYTLHWNLSSGWSSAATVSAGTGSELHGIAGLSNSNVWAVGYYLDSNNLVHTFIEQYTGSSSGWNQVSSPTPDSGDMFNGIAVLATNGNTWAMGSGDSNVSFAEFFN